MITDAERAALQAAGLRPTSRAADQYVKELRRLKTPLAEPAPEPVVEEVEVQPTGIVFEVTNETTVDVHDAHDVHAEDEEEEECSADM